MTGLKLTPAATAAYNSSLTTSTPADLLKELSATTLSSIGGYTLTRTLGEGTFGKVKLARHRLTNTLVAIKIVDKIHAPAVVREISTWRHMHHPNIARLYEVMTSETRIYMVTEFCEGGEAFDYVCAHGRFDDTGPDVRRVFRQLVEAVGYCHDRRFVHRDLKLENVLLDYSLNVKLIDFGFTREINPRNLLDTYCGSIGYAAPEMIIGKQYDGSQVDVWSLGVIFYTLVCGYLPFDDDNESTMKRKILALDYDLPAFLAPDTCALIRAMLKLEGRERVTLKGILGDGWF
ncbi:kinase-like domain-containing protein, partial [Fimicolochytrium jonesii]|uniref:kinase-like domain-containing protein n=1 Tax=Fimicolochytrium jonesii TaxID=1396493 RepID=UPI0022FE1FA5